MGDENTGAIARQRWAQLLEQQNSMFTEAVNGYDALKARVKELEQELSVWKIAFQTSTAETVVLKEKVSKLERDMALLENDIPLVVALIDGDGHLFSKELVSQGQSGGREAARLLIEGIREYNSRKDDTTLSRAQIWVSVYCNLNGLQETFANYKICTKEEFNSFVLGFNQAAPLINIIDAGNGKEAADSKIKEGLRIFSRFPQISRIFFGGAHDNGYTTTLTSLENEGLLRKIILLLGYKDLATELRALNLPQARFKDVFMENKLSGKTVKPSSNLKEPTGESNKTSKVSSNALEPSMLNGKLKPPPCNLFYLSPKGCPHESRCHFGHAYIIQGETLEYLRKNALKTPCSYVNKDQMCPEGELCLYGHFCPFGKRCTFLRQGKCRFTGKTMHAQGVTNPPSTPRKSKKVLRPVFESDSPHSGATLELEEDPYDDRIMFPQYEGKKASYTFDY